MKQPTEPLKTFSPDKKDLPAAPTLPYNIPPDFKGYFSRLGLIRPLIAVTLVGIVVYRNALLGAFIAAAIAIILAVMYVLVSRRKFTLTDSQLEYRNAFGKVTTLGYENIKDVHVFANYLDAGFGIVPRIIIEKKDGTAFVSFNLLYWSVTSVDRALSALRAKKVKTTYYSDIAQGFQITKQFPQLLSYNERHPFRVAWLIILGIVIVVAIVTIVTMPQ